MPNPGSPEAEERLMICPKNVRQWFFFPIEMPINARGEGPATVGVDAVHISYEVWDQLLNTHSQHDNLSDAINEAMRLNGRLALGDCSSASCPPCTNSCNQGRSCPNRRQRSLGNLWAAIMRMMKGERE